MKGNIALPKFLAKIVTVLQRQSIYLCLRTEHSLNQQLRNTVFKPNNANSCQRQVLWITYSDSQVYGKFHWERKFGMFRNSGRRVSFLYNQEFNFNNLIMTFQFHSQFHVYNYQLYLSVNIANRVQVLINACLLLDKDENASVTFSFLTCFNWTILALYVTYGIVQIL